MSIRRKSRSKRLELSSIYNKSFERARKVKRNDLESEMSQTSQKNYNDTLIDCVMYKLVLFNLSIAPINALSSKKSPHVSRLDVCYS